MRGKWRHAAARSGMNTAPLSEYEQPLPIREHGDGLSFQRDADTSVTDAAARVRGGWRHTVAMSNVDTKLLSKYEQPLPIHEHDGGLLRQCDADNNVTDAVARVRRGVASCRHEVTHGHGAAIRLRTTATNPQT